MRSSGVRVSVVSDLYTISIAVVIKTSKNDDGN